MLFSLFIYDHFSFLFCAERIKSYICTCLSKLAIDDGVASFFRSPNTDPVPVFHIIGQTAIQ